MIQSVDRTYASSAYEPLDRSGSARSTRAPGDKEPANSSRAGTDTAEISEAARQLSKMKAKVSSSEADLSEEDQKRVKQLKQTDQQVHAHEQAHLASAGNLAKSGARFEYETGPDGNRYAVGGEVNIDTSEVKDDPKATLTKAARIRQAALAPADPSAQDRAVAAEAAAMAAKAQQELAKQGSSSTASRAA
jgi:hypothetical protein